MNFKVTGLEQT